jgi:hypothetical protein
VPTPAPSRFAGELIEAADVVTTNCPEGGLTQGLDPIQLLFPKNFCKISGNVIMWDREMTAPSPPAVRMRRTRERRRQGDVLVSLEVGPKVTGDLVDLGWLLAPDRGDKNAVTRAMTELIERAIEVRVTPAPDSQGKVSFMLEIRHSTIDTLVTLGWLPAHQRDDLAATVTAFRRFAGRSLDIARNSAGVQ